MAEATALQQALDPHIEADEEDAQLGLFSEPQTEHGKRKAQVQFGAAGFGRPPGARNRRTQATVEFILSRHRDPRVVLAEMAAANVHDLAALLGCTLFEAYQEKRLSAIGLLPYVAARITPEVIDNRQVIHLHLGGLEGGGAAAGASAVHVLEAGDYETVAEGASAATDDGSEG